MNWRFWRKADAEDFSSYLPGASASPKEQLIAKCQRLGIAVHMNDSSEPGTGAYAAMRAVASEAELQSRLTSHLALSRATWANRIAWLALLVAFVGLIVAVAK